MLKKFPGCVAIIARTISRFWKIHPQRQLIQEPGLDMLLSGLDEVLVPTLFCALEQLPDYEIGPYKKEIVVKPTLHVQISNL